jgi:curved DNA-binding protein CbpA
VNFCYLEESMNESSQHPTNLYTILGVDIKASQECIRQQYLKLARIWHPDRHTGPAADPLAAKRRFQEISAAFSVLSNVKTRQQYDMGLLDLLDVEDYLQRFQGLILTACGLGMSSGNSSNFDLESSDADIAICSSSACSGPTQTWCLTAA